MRAQAPRRAPESGSGEQTPFFGKELGDVEVENALGAALLVLGAEHVEVASAVGDERLLGDLEAAGSQVLALAKRLWSPEHRVER